MVDRQTDGTAGITTGSLRSNRKGLPFELRVVGFSVAVVAVAFLIVLFDTNIWRAQGRLREGFAAIKAEKFYFGVNFRVQLRKLTATLLDFRLTGNPADLEPFHRDSQELRGWLRTKERSFIAPGERRALTRLESAYEEFLGRLGRSLTVPGPTTSPREDFRATYARIREEARPVLAACDEVVEAEHGEFDVFVGNADQALTALQRLFLLSLLLLVGLAMALAVLVYRGMIAPLRARLSESKELIARQEKLAALGALGAGVAHEIRNPLTAIKCRLFSLRESLPPNFADSEDARTISDEINRLSRIVKDFLEFARPSEPELTPLPAERLLHEVAELMRSELELCGIGLKLEVVSPSWIRADLHQLKQVLINLIQNAAESIREKGLITLRLTSARSVLAGSLGPTALMSVVDNGSGIPPEVQRRLFDPFFTTKDGGTGLGLAIAARIVEKHGGQLSYKTEVNRGTTFQIALPEENDHAG